MGVSEERLRVLVCSPTGGTGGIASVTQTLAGWHRSHPECGWGLRILPMDNRLHPTATGKVAGKAGRMIRGLRVYVPWLLRFRRVLRMVRPDVVHVNSSGGMGHLRDLVLLALCRRAGIPAVVQLHHGRFGSGLLRGERELVRMVAAVASGMIVLDGESLRRLSEIAPGSVVRLVANPAPEVGGEPCRGMVDPCRLVFAGHVSRRKGVDMLIRTVGQMKGYTLDIFGPDPEGMMREWRLPGNVVYHGVVSREEVIAAMRGGVMVLPSLSEGRPATILEAMAVGAAVVASGVGGVPEMLGMRGPWSGLGKAPCGILVEAGSERWLKAGLRLVGEDMEGTAARIREGRCMAGRFSAAEVSSALEVVWRGLI